MEGLRTDLGRCEGEFTVTMPVERIKYGIPCANRDLGRMGLEIEV
jgi:hypothetical protein